jgi:hypothetical protein
MMRATGWFQVFCPRGRRHRVTAYRVTERSPSGLSVQTKLCLASGAEVRRVAAGRYEADGLGLLVRLTWVITTPTAEPTAIG